MIHYYTGLSNGFENAPPKFAGSLPIKRRHKNCLFCGFAKKSKRGSLRTETRYR